MLLEDLWQARKCCWEVLGIELLVVIWIGGRQACRFTWVNFNLKSPSFFVFISLLVFLLLAWLVSLDFL